jgi:hypothetical protein
MRHQVICSAPLAAIDIPTPCRMAGRLALQPWDRSPILSTPSARVLVNSDRPPVPHSACWDPAPVAATVTRPDPARVTGRNKKIIIYFFLFFVRCYTLRKKSEGTKGLRPPSYTDRVLCHSMPDLAEDLTIEEYDMCEVRPECQGLEMTPESGGMDR